MALEIELKLRLDIAHVESLKQILTCNPDIQSLECQQLENTYYDTADQQLTAHLIALRIRKKNNKLIQTVKTRGKAGVGMHSRSEWEWEIPSAQLDFSLLKKTNGLKELDLAEVQQHITPIFNVEFARTTWLLDCHKDPNNPLKAELALDIGTVSTDGRQMPICELELELLEGDANHLIPFALELAKQVPLLPCDISKAERGYRLLDSKPFKRERTTSYIQHNITTEQLFCQLLEQELSLWTYYFEIWRITKEPKQTSIALSSLKNIQALYQNFTAMLPAETTKKINIMLDSIVKQLQDINIYFRLENLVKLKGSWLEQQAYKANSKIDKLLQTTEIGVLALELSLQLVEKSWQLHWTEQQQRVANRCLLEG